MEILENLYLNPPVFSNFFARKYTIKNKKTLLCGCKKSGISYIIFDFLSTLKPKSYIYINLQDIRISKNKLQNLDLFIKKNKITSVVLENYTLDITLPDVENIILSTNHTSLHVKDFSTLKIKPLNFEEFIASMQRNFNIEHIFSLYTKAGTYAKSTFLNEYENKIYLQECLNVFFQDNICYELFCLLAKHQATTYSAFEAYNELKKSIKISKDKLYQKLNFLIDTNVIFLMEKFNTPKAKKKIFLTNFAFKSAITYEKDFNKRFENMVFFHLHVNDEEAYYLDDISFYLPQKQQAILCIAFLPYEFIVRKFYKILPKLKALHVNSLCIITLSSEGHVQKDGILCEILPFWNWALSYN